MANPQLENGKTEIANELAEALARVNFTAHEMRILWVIFRKTYGWHKKTDRISYSQFELATGIDHRHIGRTIKTLKARNIITCEGHGYQLEYGLQKNYDKWYLTPSQAPIIEKNLTPSQDNLTPSQDNLTPSEALNLTPSEAHTKAIKHIQKHITKASYVFVLPDWLNKNTWESFVEMRKQIKNAPLTEWGKHLLVIDLEKFKANGHDPNKIVEESIKHAWKGFFAPKLESGDRYHGNVGLKKQPPGVGKQINFIDGDADPQGAGTH